MACKSLFAEARLQHVSCSKQQDLLTKPPPPAAHCPAPCTLPAAVVDGDIKPVSLADYRGKYVVLFFYPKDFTFVCPTEIM